MVSTSTNIEINKMTINTKARDRYNLLKAEAEKQLKLAQENLKELSEAKDEDIHWGHVSDMGRMVETLKNVNDVED